MANHTNSNCRIIAGEESGDFIAFILFVLACWGISAVGLSKLTLPRWRMTLSMSGLPTVVAILAYCFLPESARFNIIKGRWAQVKKYIKTKLLADSVDANPRELEQIPDAKLGESSTSAIEKGKVNIIKASDRVEPNSCSKIWSESIGVLAKRPDQHFSFFAVASTWFFVSGASWGLSTWLPTIIERKEQGGKFGMDPSASFCSTAHVTVSLLFWVLSLLKGLDGNLC